MTSRPKGDAGLTLIELAVAIVVLSLGSLATLRAVDQARLSIGGAQDRVLASLAARNRAELLGLPSGNVALPNTVTLGGRVFTLATETLPTAGGLIQATITARSENGPGARVIVYLSPGDL
ncbi:MAG: prepilin-type N-terminal cleavage/methylation domain-containing protein [Pseudomonadota bacterium]